MTASSRYAKEFLAGWARWTATAMANTAHFDMAADAWMACVVEHGFPPSAFRRLSLGPVIRKEELEDFREIGLDDTVTVTYAALATGPDGPVSCSRKRSGRPRGERAATIRSTGGWLHNWRSDGSVGRISHIPPTDAC